MARNKKNRKLFVEELQAQIAVGSIKSAREISTIIKFTDDKAVILWATHYKSALVRAEAAKKDNLPFGRLLRMLFFDKATSVRDAAAMTLTRNHSANLKQLFYLVEDFPQLSLNLAVNKVEPKNITHESYNKHLHDDVKNICGGDEDEAYEEYDTVEKFTF